MKLIVEIENIIQECEAKVGFAYVNFNSGETCSVNGLQNFPMQSVYKFHLALRVLSELDQGIISLDQKIYIKESELIPNIWSPLRDRFGKRNLELNLSELLAYAVSQSDNVACDVLFRLIGGPTVVNDFISGLGVSGVSILNTEEEIQGD